MPYLALTLLLLAATSSLEAQKKCKTGIPCGNSCIAANKVCRIGSTSTPAQPAGTSAGATGSSGAASSPATPSALPPPEDELVNMMDLPAGDSTWPWVGSRLGGEYYPRTCQVWRAFEPGMLVFFRTQREATAYGRRRSTVGCL